ncbi:MAG: OmpA family protein [Ignavibacteria bacterium]|jgi:outer membrane protein OmpA-like peptidoglycan-associated protein|nr:OmpA family protein [Ignavibacteria bacterium]
MKYGKLTLLLLLCIIATVSLQAQVQQWAKTVIEASSYNSGNGFGGSSYAPQQVLGSPSVMDDYGESFCAWSPKSNKRNDYIVVSFEKSMQIEQVAIAENFNPGAIVKVTVYGEGKEQMVYSNSDPKPIQQRGRMFNIYCDKTPFRVDRVRIDINTYKYETLYQIDAICISDSKQPVELKINLSNDVLEVSDPENLGPNINSKYSELAPVITPDGKKIYFTRERHPENPGQQSIWSSEIDKDGNFAPAKVLPKPLNTQYHNFAISILPDGNSMLVGNVYYPDGRLGNGFSMTYKKGDEWSFPEQVKVKNFFNTSGRGSYCLASSGKVLLASMQRSDGFGGNDMYVSFLDDDGVWSEPKNLGADLNTADREDSPFLAADGVTLYFSSSGHPGYGSSDIFVSKRLDETWQHWSEPVNLGNKVNTKEWDAYFCITASGDYAYFVSMQNSLGNEDIFRVKLPQELRPEKVIMVSGKVIDKKSKQPVAASIHYERLSNNQSMGQARANAATGEYKIALPANDKYGFRAEAEGYIAINENLDLTKLKSKEEDIERDLYLVPLEKGQELVMNNLFFATAEYELLPESFPELERLVKSMKENPNMRIRVSGHTDNVGSASNNMTLSNNRVASVKKFIVSKGIAETRIEAKGYGATKPIASNKTDEGKAKNRRVECTIISE